jgi:hypothetical protein
MFDTYTQKSEISPKNRVCVIRSASVPARNLRLDLAAVYAEISMLDETNAAIRRENMSFVLESLSTKIALAQLLAYSR